MKHLNGEDNPLNEEARRGLAEDGLIVHDMVDEPPAPNSAARAEIIREAHETISEYERQVAGLKAEIKAAIETRIVAGLGMKKGDFALARKLLEIDDDDRDGLFSTIRECFAALGVGMQSNWLDAYTRDGAGAELGAD